MASIPGASGNTPVTPPPPQQQQQQQQADVYTHGFHKSVTSQHAKRSVESCADHLLRAQVLEAGATSLLDVGCGPGSITVGFAKRCRQVTGVDFSEEVLALAADAVKEADATNVAVRQASVYELPFEDDTFDVAHAHQVLQHLSDPVAALKEMRRVVKPGGVVAVRDADYESMLVHPPVPAIDEWRRIYRATCVQNKAQPDAGRYLKQWMLDAGFDPAQTAHTMSVVPHHTKEACEDWGLAWKDRALKSSFAAQAQEYGLASESELQAISDAWAEWPQHPGACLYYVNGEALAYVT